LFICFYPRSRLTVDQRVVVKLARTKPQTRSFGRNSHMRPERDDTETRGSREKLDKETGRVVYVWPSKYSFAYICRSPRSENKLQPAGAACLWSRKVPFTSPVPSILGHIHDVGAAAGTSYHSEEGYIPKTETRRSFTGFISLVVLSAVCLRVAAFFGA